MRNDDNTPSGKTDFDVPIAYTKKYDTMAIMRDLEESLKDKKYLTCVVCGNEEIKYGMGWVYERGIGETKGPFCGKCMRGRANS